MDDIKKRIHTMDLILVVIAVLLFVFTATMIVVFCLFQDIPDTLCTCVFAVCGTECGAMAWIKTNKDKLEEKIDEKVNE